MISSSWTTAAAPGVWRVSKTEKTTHSSEWEWKKLYRTLIFVGWRHLKSASPSTGRCVQLTTGKSHFQHRTGRCHLSSRSQNSCRWVTVKPRRHLAVVGAATWPPFPVFISESSFQFPSSFQHVNVDGTKVLLAAAYQARHQPRRFIYVSTDEVYGASTDQVSRRGFDRLVGLSHTATGWFYCAGLWWEQSNEAVQSLFCYQSSCRVPGDILLGQI